MQPPEENQPPETPWIRARKSNSAQQEQRFARGRGRQQPNSGRRWHSPGDVTLNSFIGRILVDNKTHDNPEKQSYRITRDEWLKLRTQANRTPPGCSPALQIDIQELHLLAMELDLWDEIVEYVMRLEATVEKLREANDGGHTAQ